jgi:hypothetical protein
MRRTHLRFSALAAIALTATAARAGTFTHIATLDLPVSGVLATDKAGDLLAETNAFQNPAGAVILLKAASNYAVRRTLYTFGAFGAYPRGGVTLQGSIILGTTYQGGSGAGGTAFSLGELSAITPTVLHAFSIQAPDDAYNPESGLTAGPDGLLYGTTNLAGQQGSPNQVLGAVFQVGPDAANPQYSVLHQFSSSQYPAGTDGAEPTQGRLAADQQGRLFGLTISGGVYGQIGIGGGTVFVMQQLGGVWQEQVAFNFDGGDPGQLSPTTGSNVIEDAHGDLFACLYGGLYSFGGLIELQPTQNPKAPWREKVLVQFGVHSYDSYVYTSCAITQDPASNMIFGVTDRGGRQNLGTLFTLAPPTAQSAGEWTYTVVHNFAGTGRDGAYPSAAPLELNGAFYGSAADVIWRYTP